MVWKCEECGERDRVLWCIGKVIETDRDGLPERSLFHSKYCQRRLCGVCVTLVKREDGYCRECAAGGGKRPGTIDPAKQAAISPCELYRWSLRRVWDPDRPRIFYLGLNPSKADAEENDPTVGRWIDFSRRWGYGSFSVGNLFAYRSTDPAGLAKAADPIGSLCDEWIDREAAAAATIVCCWGSASKLRGAARKAFLERAEAVTRRLPAASFCFGKNADGTPKHPLYLSRFVPLEPFAVPAASIEEPPAPSLF